ncbi:glycosyltransferase [Desulfopila aestuarii]|uniref:Glycosyltransferase involved in cell wall bisynthesis n=1 Tax=Desulfopila aestuarii DSM 18488 TaxID=1121416 RepID=A0A1M7Y362_9BACT|nr:glycosyltransferase [Desulfopila aestuarii]SHO46449.1 Glycosyltransferase involved in cell wall bisynthesis [Desulfopila aestuarii DSM 18488]
MTTSSGKKRTILWWGRFDPDYSRNRILRRFLVEGGYTLSDFRPRSSFFGALEAVFHNLGSPDAVWVGAFRQSDFNAARRFADRRGIPLIFDPLISAWDKQVFERQKFSKNSRKAKRLKRWEKQMFSRADLVLADTELHARFFIDELGADPDKTVVVPVGAEEQLFTEQPHTLPDGAPEILFYGSFIHLQGPEVIVEAAKLVPEARWTLLGEGPLKKVCEEKASGHSHINFEGWCPYEQLAARIGKADVLLGVFGDSAKAGRVIPNKAYQALACGRPLITRESDAYPENLCNGPDAGIVFVPAGDPEVLAAEVRNFIMQQDMLPDMGKLARVSYETWFSEKKIRESLMDGLQKYL